MNKFIKYILVLLVFTSIKLKATHNRAGEILYKRIAPFTALVGGVTKEVYTYSITVIKYTNDGSQIADRCADTVYFGDGTRGVAPRINHNGSVSCNECPTKCGEMILTLPNFRVKKSIYTIIHTYPGIGSYKIRSFDPNRNEGVINIPLSINRPFYIESYLEINSFTGSNSSPQFNYPPIDRGCTFNCFFHNPGAYDSDGDSLSYEIAVSRGESGDPLPGYTFPDPGPGGIYEINAMTGKLTWCTPQLQGEYNLAFIVREWRKNTSGRYFQIGYVLRDMQVLVGVCINNQPPNIVVPQDTCVEAGTLINKKLIISDPNPGNIIRLEGEGGAFSAASPTANIAPISGTSSYISNFSWQTDCNHIRVMPYFSTFKVNDQVQPINQVNFGTYSIKVVPPKINGLVAQPLGTAVSLTWQPSSCNPPLNPLVKYVIYRSNNCATFTYVPCKPGVDPTSGYIKVGETSATNFTDNNNGAGLTVGENYSYVVVAVYTDGSSSFASSAICAQLKKDIPIITNVDIEATSATTGSILVKWVKPFTNAGNFDTLAFPGPYTIKVNYKSQSSATLTTIFATSTPNFYQLATQTTHTAVNTADERKEYKLEFSSGTVTIGSSQLATSIFLSATPGDRLIKLAWASSTPWSNYKYTVYRKNPGQTTFTAIATSSVTNFIDSINVANRSTYCYYILSEGQYSDATIPRPLLNKSQEACATAVDLTPPCTPTLSTNADCITGFVNLSWTNTKICPGGNDVIKYILYYKPTVDDEYKVLDTVKGIDKTVYNIDYASNNQEFISGCYAISAMDSSKNVSTRSQDYCIDICPLFELPNIVTVNGDGVNDFYKAIKVRQIKEINLLIFDRWGNLVYETKDPYFKWDCKSKQSGQTVSDGTFFYVCDVYEQRVTGKKTRKLKGFMQVVK